MEVAGWSDETDALARIHAYPCAEVVIKRGAEPALARTTGQDWIAVAAERVTRVVDTTAAGDLFRCWLSRRPPAWAFAGRGAGRRQPPGGAAVIQCPGAIIPFEKMPAGLLA